MGQKETFVDEQHFYIRNNFLDYDGAPSFVFVFPFPLADGMANLRDGYLNDKFPTFLHMQKELLPFFFFRMEFRRKTDGQSPVERKMQVYVIRCCARRLLRHQRGVVK